MSVKNMRRLVFILLVFTVTSCSSRVIYERPSALPSANTININTATADELERLPHVGRKTAEAIVSYRTQFGPFRRPESLMQVRGVSESRFVDIKPYIRAE